MKLQLFAAGGSLITRLYDLVDGQKIGEAQLDGEYDRIHLWMNGKLGDINLAADADIQGSKIKVNTIPTDRIIGNFYTSTQVDTKIANAALGTAPDRSVLGVKLVLATVTPAELDRVYFSAPIRLGHTWALSGTVAVPVGDTDYILPFFVSLAAGQKQRIVKARYRINSGTSVTASVQKNGVNVTGYINLSITPTTTEVVPATVALADNDMIALVVSAVAGAPKNMTFTLFIEDYA